jgi:hypothetical protein
MKLAPIRPVFIVINQFNILNKNKMNKSINEEYDDTLCPLTDMFEKVTQSNYQQYAQIANIQYNFLLNSNNSNGYHFVNWRVNFANLHNFILENSKTEKDISVFLKSYEDSAPILYKKLGLEY